MKENEKLEFHGGIFSAVLPFILFIASCIVFFVILQYYEMIALALGAFVALIIGSLLSKNWSKYWDAVVAGMSQPLINTLALIFIVVGIFAKMMAKSGVADGFVWLGMKLGLHGSLFCAFTFLIAALIASATGTSFGTIFTCFPILYPSGILLGASPVFLAGAILSGAILGDNIAPISDTTIASAGSQSFKNGKNADIAGVVASRLKYVAVAAPIAFVLFLIFGGKGAISTTETVDLISQYSNPTGLAMLIPVAVLLIIAFKTGSIFIAVTWGLLSGCVVALPLGLFGFKDIVCYSDGALSGFLIEGINNMVGTVIFLYGMSGIMGILNASGALDKLVEALQKSKITSTEWGTELVICLGGIVSGICMGSAAAPAVLMFAPVAQRIGETHDLHPYRRANILSSSTFTIPVIIPATSAFIFVAISAVNGVIGEYSFIPDLNPASFVYSTFYAWTMLATVLLFIFTGIGRLYEGPNGEKLKTRPQK